MRFGKRSTENSKILRENINKPAVYFAITGYYSIPKVILLIKAKILGTVHYKLPGFLESSLVNEQINAFAGSKFSFFVLGFLTDNTASQQ